MARTTIGTMICGVAALLAAVPALAVATPDWTARCRLLIAAKQDYPRAAQMRGEEGTARVKVDVAADGTITAVALLQPTGSMVLDREALAAPRKVGTFPAPPGGAATIVVPITWKMM